ncbi:MAG: hypothetical protein WC938_01020 [Candidatus Paceibacterota bacterium]|jgi:hypothetical protein
MIDHVIILSPVKEDVDIEKLIPLSGMEHENCGGKIKEKWEAYRGSGRTLILLCQRCKTFYPLVVIGLNGAPQEKNTDLVRILKGYDDYDYFKFSRDDDCGKLMICNKEFRKKELSKKTVHY